MDTTATTYCANVVILDMPSITSIYEIVHCRHSLTLLTTEACHSLLFAATVELCRDKQRIQHAPMIA